MVAGLVDRWIERLNTLITERSKVVILVFLIVTAAFAGGLSGIESEEGTAAFAEGIPSQEALETIQAEFDPAFEPDTQSTQLIVRGENVLDQNVLIRLLVLQEVLEEDDEYRVEETSSIVQGVAQTLDPTATTTTEQRAALESATDSETREAVRTAGQDPGFAASVSDDFSRTEPYASATIATVEHDEDADIVTVQERVQDRAESLDGDVVVFGQGILQSEFENVVVDSLTIVVPVVVVLILVFLIAAYRDPFDLLLGLVTLCMAIVWTFGFTGYAGIAFSELMIAVPPLLLAIGIDFGIHAVNRYREERVKGATVAVAMSDAAAQLLIAFFIVTGTTIIGFGANVVSDLDPIREFGIVASVGIIFTFLLFGIFLPAAKISLDRFRDRHDLPSFSTSPLGSEESILGRVLPAGVHLAVRAPIAMLLVIALVTGGAAAYATTVDTTFDDEDFLPPEELPGYVEDLPEPFAPGEYTVTATINYLEATFESGEDDEVILYFEGPLRQDYALESIERGNEDPPDSFVTDDDGNAETTSIVDVMHLHAEQDDEFARLLAANDRSGNGVPDRNVDGVLEYLFESESGDLAREYMTDDGRSMQIVYAVEADAGQEVVTDDARSFTSSFRFDTTATGDIVVFQEISDIIFESAITSLALALLFTAAFLMVVYWVLEGRATLGIANLVPIVVTVAVLGGTMPLLDIPLNALTGTALSITIGVGVAYSVHVTHRFIDEYNDGHDARDSLLITLQGTGGALTGSMLTTLGGAGSLVLAITPILGQFGFLMVISVVYSYLMAIVVLPPTLILWARYVG